MGFVIWAIVLPLLVVGAGFVVEHTRGARCERRRRRAAAGEHVRLPARLGLRSNRWMPRGVLLRDGDELLWLSRRPFGRPARFDPALLAAEGRFVDATGSDFVDRTFRDYALRTDTGGTLRVPDWLTPALEALRTTPGPPRRRALVATAAPRWLALLPAAVVVAFSPLALAWVNGEDVRAEVTGHDREYSMCNVVWESPRGSGTATIDCDLEPIGTTVQARALGEPFAGNAADMLWTPHALIILFAAGTAVPVGVLLMHLLPTRLRRPLELTPSPDRTLEARVTRGQTTLGRPPQALGEGRTRWQERAVAQAALDGLPPLAERSIPAWATRWRVAWGTATSAAGGWLFAAACFLLLGALVLGFAVPAAWTLSRTETTVVTGEVIETSRFFLTRESIVVTGDDEELRLTSWARLENSQQVRLTRAGDVAALPGDPGHWIDLGQGAAAFILGGLCLYVARRRIRTARPEPLTHDPAGDTQSVPYAAFRMPDGPTLVVLLDHTGASHLAVPVRGAVPPAGLATVPRTLQAGHVIAPVIDDRLRSPHEAVEDINDDQLQELLDDIA